MSFSVETDAQGLMPGRHKEELGQIDGEVVSDQGNTMLSERFQEAIRHLY
jgi:hypothetical protein